MHEALTTRLPLPQFLPSARLAHLRMINKVREIVPASFASKHDQKDHDKVLRNRRRKYMSWNASSAAQAEIIEYLEELTDLTKLLVGANEFRTGLLTRPTYREYVQKVSGSTIVSSSSHDIEEDRELAESEKENRDGLREISNTTEGLSRMRSRRASTVRTRASVDTSAAASAVGGDVPISLQRIQSRKSEDRVQMQKQRTQEG